LVRGAPMKAWLTKAEMKFLGHDDGSFPREGAIVKVSRQDCQALLIRARRANEQRSIAFWLTMLECALTIERAREDARG
jgi:hypothetical protein